LLGPLLAQAKQIPDLRWANGVAVKEELEKQVVVLIGPKDERDMPVKGKVRSYMKESKEFCSI